MLRPREQDISCSHSSLALDVLTTRLVNFGIRSKPHTPNKIGESLVRVQCIEGRIYI